MLPSTYIRLGIYEVLKMNTQTTIQDKYGSIARSVTQSSATACCDPAMRCCDPITKDLYTAGEFGELPEKAVLASLGCGNPTALIDLRPGETVLDLGSGGGIDVLLSARRVGPTGFAYGLDMTDDMLALARENQRAVGAMNVEFLKGTIEAIPLPDSSVDVVISNCVINLSGEVPDEVRQSMLLWVGCIAGALEEDDYRTKLAAAGFTGIDLEPTRTYDIEDARVFLTEAGIAVNEIAPQVEGKFLSAFIRATKPTALETKACCGPTCCS
jgi:SAM-dependent methyltransferase